MAPHCSPVMPLSSWRRRDSTNSAPTARVSVCLPDGAQVLRELRINYNMTEVRAILADEIRFDPDQLDIYCDSEPEPVPDSLVLAGLDVEHRDLTLHLQLKSPVTSAATAAPAVAPAPAVAEDSEPSTAEPTSLSSKPTKGHDGGSHQFARRVYEYGWRRRCSLRRR